MTRTELSHLPVTELAAVLRQLGGTPEDVLMDPSILTLIQPLLAADFAINEAYGYYPEPRLDMPITAFAGSRDPGARPEDMARWRDETSAGWSMEVLDGGHFAIFGHATVVQQRIARDLVGRS